MLVPTVGTVTIVCSFVAVFTLHRMSVVSLFWDEINEATRVGGPAIEKQKTLVVICG